MHASCGGDDGDGEPESSRVPNASEILTGSSDAVAISYCCFIRFLKKFRRRSRRSVVFYSQSEQPP